MTRIARLDSRALVRVSGPDARPFLHNLLTQDVETLAPGELRFGALLSPPGRLLFDLFLSGEADGVLLDVAADRREALLQRLSMYRLRADVALAPAGIGVRRGTGPAPEGALPDPRHPALGWRLYGAGDGEDGTDWDALRVEHVIPETGIELTPETYILEAGFERLNGVDFRKGCYVGQEVTARMKHRGLAKKRLMRVALEGAPPPPGAPILLDG
ncbi:MAG: YgfZ/GcvT domain-containing protein, partial [Alphaproteobacteria bacterium]